MRLRGLAKNGVKSYEINEADIGIGNSKITIVRNCGDMQIAYKLWVELSTRKIGLSIDLDNDVIAEVYDSWYEFFKMTRELVDCTHMTGQVRLGEPGGVGML